ncbi:hypothetical protein SUGI_0440630 [Cryptomeria japonica]|nr:hypothetical protein SUGI_0440630 [Cryptomeria japonica]
MSTCQYAENGGKQFQQIPSDSNLTHFGKQNNLRNLNYKIKERLEKSALAQRTLLIVVMIGTCMVIGDGALTPAISVLSAIEGIQAENSTLTNGVVVGTSAEILALLFLVQRFGTGKVSFLFSPVALVWFASNSIIGVGNVLKFYPGVFKAVNPYYIVRFFEKNRHHGWVSLGGRVLALAGSEGMFADMGHINKDSIQIAFSFLVYPAQILTYSGQAAYLIKHKEDVELLLGFRDGTSIGNASGVAVIMVMLITTCLNKKYRCAMEKKLSPRDMNEMVANVDCRVPGVSFLCSDILYGTPPIFRHYVNTVGSLHEIFIFLTIRMVPAKSVLLEERYQVRPLGPKGIYRCLAQYGYMDDPTMEGNEFINQGIESIKEYNRTTTREGQYNLGDHSMNGLGVILNEGRTLLTENNFSACEEVQQLESAKNVGAMFVLGKATLKTSNKSSAFERFMIDNIYDLLQKNGRSAMSTLDVPPARLLHVGMVYEI